MFLECFAVVRLLISHFLEQFNGSCISLLDLGDNLVFLVFGGGKLLDDSQRLSGHPLPPESLFGNHDIDFALVLVDPLRKEQIDIADHGVFVENYEGVFGWVIEPGLLVGQFLFEAEGLAPGQLEELWVAHPFVVGLHVVSHERPEF